MASDQNGFKKPMALGSKARSFIPMTPRSLKSNHKDSYNEFAKQVDEASQPSRDHDGQPPQKRFRSNKAPKGSRLAQGYTDRARERSKEQEVDGEDVQKRLKALEDMFKLQQIDQATFDKLREQLGIGGDTSSTHLVKGLDFKLLERVRRGEDINQVETKPAQPGEIEDEAIVEDELEKALEKDVSASTAEQLAEQNQERDTDSLTVGQNTPAEVLSRDEILRRLKNNRKNPAQEAPTDQVVATPQPGLNQSRFRKLESAPKSNKRKFTESINGRRREVLVITAKDGTTKRKTRWLDPEPDPVTQSRNKDQHAAWGADLPAELIAKQKAAEEAAKREEDDGDEGDIFGGVADYNPLAGMDSEDEDTGDKQPPADDPMEPAVSTTTEQPAGLARSSTNPLKSTSQSRNYFGTPVADEEINSNDPSQDPSILAALKRAAQIRRDETSEMMNSESRDEDGTDDRTLEDKEKSKALLARLQKQSGQDDMDLDMGFGGNSRYDEEDEGDGKQKLAEWRGADFQGEDDEEATGHKDGSAKRKRGGKKRKGDKNSYADVMSVIEGRKKG